MRSTRLKTLTIIFKSFVGKRQDLLINEQLIELGKVGDDGDRTGPVANVKTTVGKKTRQKSNDVGIEQLISSGNTRDGNRCKGDNDDGYTQSAVRRLKL